MWMWPYGLPPMSTRAGAERRVPRHLDGDLDAGGGVGHRPGEALPRTPVTSSPSWRARHRAARAGLEDQLARFAHGVGRRIEAEHRGEAEIATVAPIAAAPRGAPRRGAAAAAAAVKRMSLDRAMLSRARSSELCGASVRRRRRCGRRGMRRPALGDTPRAPGHGRDARPWSARSGRTSAGASAARRAGSSVGAPAARTRGRRNPHRAAAPYSSAGWSGRSRRAHAGPPRCCRPSDPHSRDGALDGHPVPVEQFRAGPELADGRKRSRARRASPGTGAGRPRRKAPPRTAGRRCSRGKAVAVDSRCAGRAPN